MEQVPVMISTKDLAYLTDIFSWNYNASKVAHNYFSITNNQELKDVFHDVFSIHKEICEDVLDILEYEDIMSKKENHKMEVPSGIEINDKDMLIALLEIEKNMSVNLTIAMNEASNENLYERLFDSFETIKDLQRDLYEIAFRYGWYSLEEAEDSKVSEEYNKLNEEINDLNCID